VFAGQRAKAVDEGGVDGESLGAVHGGGVAVFDRAGSRDGPAVAARRSSPGDYSAVLANLLACRRVSPM
jgi:hypothetical protein